MAQTNDASIQISEWIQPSSITELNENQFILIEFWATWCGPCHQINEHVEYIQQYNSENLFVMSLSNEAPLVVETFLEKHKMNTSIALDDKDQTFNRFKVTALPYAVIISPGGYLIWKGHPSGLSPEAVAKMIANNKEKSIPLYQKIKVKPAVEMAVQEPFLEKDGFRYRPLPHSCPFSVQTKDSEYYWTGSLQDILIDLLPLAKNQIKSNLPPQYLELYCDTASLASSIMSITETLLNEYQLELSAEQETVRHLELSIEDSSKLWSTDIIDWGEDSPGYLIDDRNIKADNQSLTQLSHQLEASIGAQLSIQYDNGESHDWDIHIKHYPLMVEQMKEEYGINVVDKGYVQEHILVLRKGKQ